MKIYAKWLLFVFFVIALGILSPANAQYSDPAPAKPPAAARQSNPGNSDNRPVPPGKATTEFGELAADGVRWNGRNPDARKLNALVEQWKKGNPGRSPKITINTIQPPDR